MLFLRRVARVAIRFDHSPGCRARTAPRRRRVPARALLPGPPRRAGKRVHRFSRPPGVPALRPRDGARRLLRNLRRDVGKDPLRRSHHRVSGEVRRLDRDPARDGVRRREGGERRDHAAAVSGRPRGTGSVLMAAPTEKRFWLLRRLSRVMSVLAWVVLVLIALVVPVGFARAIVARSPEDFMQTLAYGVSGGFIFIYLLYMAQWIQVILAVEENTKQTTYVLEKLTTLMQQVRDRLGESSEQLSRESGEKFE